MLTGPMQRIGTVEYHRFDYRDAIASTCRLDVLSNDVSILLSIGDVIRGGH